MNGRRISAFTGLALVAALLLPHASIAAGRDASLEDGVVALLEDARRAHDLSGATAAWVLADGTVGTAAVGLSDAENERVMTPHSRMLAASIGKSFVGATVLALESEERLSRDDRLAEHLGTRDWFARLPNAADTTEGSALVPTLEAALADLILAAQAEPATLVTNVSIVDVEAGSVARAQSVLIRDGAIAAIGPDLDAELDAEGVAIERVDADGGYLIPGLWDSHVHLFSSPDEPDTALPLYLSNGITGVRDMGALWPIERQRALQARIEAGETVGPRLVLSGAWVDASPGSWPGMFLADTPDQARAVVDEIAAQRWAAVKSYSMLDEPAYLALAAAADARELPLVGHVPERVALGTAIGAGQDGMEHFGRVTMGCSTAEADMLDELRAAMRAGASRERVFEIMAARNRIVLETWDEARCEMTLSRMAAAGLHVSPTLVVADFYVGNRPPDDAPRMRTLPAAVREAWQQPDFRLEAMTDEVREHADASIALDRRTFLMAHRAGVPILASSDASFANPWLFHGHSLLDELELYVRIGLTPREALYTATVAPPRFFELDDQDGTIAVGRRADLVLLDANPLDGLATLREPRAVIAHGRVLDRAALDALAEDLIAAGVP